MLLEDLGYYSNFIKLPIHVFPTTQGKLRFDDPSLLRCNSPHFSLNTIFHPFLFFSSVFRIIVLLSLSLPLSPILFLSASLFTSFQDQLLFVLWSQASSYLQLCLPHIFSPSSEPTMTLGTVLGISHEIESIPALLKGLMA